MTAAPRHRHLTHNMRAALVAARSQPLRRVHKPGNGRPAWPAPPSTLAALVRRGLFARSDEPQWSRKGYRMDVWQITDAGVDELEFVAVRSHAVLSLHVPGGSTRMMQLGTWVEPRMPEPEAIREAA